MQKFRRGDEWWGFHADRGWLRWDGTANDWVAQDDGPMPWVKSPFKRRRRRKLSEREAAMASLVPTNDDEARLLAHVLAETPTASEEERVAVGEALAGIAPTNKHEAKLLTHVLSPDAGPRPPLVFPRKRPGLLVTILWVARAIAVAGGALLLYAIVRVALALPEMMFLPW